MGLRHRLHSSLLLGGPSCGIVYARNGDDLWVGQACLLCGEIEETVCLSCGPKKDLPTGLHWTWTHEAMADANLTDCVRAILAKTHLPHWRDL